MGEITNSMEKEYLFTSESVSEGHPDKIADQVSDAILDAILIKDRYAKVACETLIKKDFVFVAGEITTTASIDIENIAKKVIKNIGYDKNELGFNADRCSVINIINQQSPEIARGIYKKKLINQGAGDQGIMFGFATKETELLMPAPIHYANKLMYKQSLLRKNKMLPWLRPDAKSQVTLKYKNGKPIGVDTIVISTQHSEEVNYKTIREGVIEEIIKPVMPKKWISESTKYLINPTGKFIIGGPLSDCGLTGRKLMVDTYGGSSRHGGGSFSGKDPSKVDRSGAYMARYIAKNIVANKIADKCEIQLSYAIGRAEPTSIMVDTFGSGKKLTDSEIMNLIKENFDLRPYSINKKLKLLNPIYQKTATYGHFGRELNFGWEVVDRSIG